MHLFYLKRDGLTTSSCRPVASLMGGHSGLLTNFRAPIFRTVAGLKETSGH